MARPNRQRDAAVALGRGGATERQPDAPAMSLSQAIDQDYAAAAQSEASGRLVSRPIPPPDVAEPLAPLHRKRKAEAEASRLSAAALANPLGRNESTWRAGKARRSKDAWIP